MQAADLRLRAPRRRRVVLLNRLPQTRLCACVYLPQHDSEKKEWNRGETMQKSVVRHQTSDTRTMKSEISTSFLRKNPYQRTNRLSQTTTKHNKNYKTTSKKTFYTCFSGSLTSSAYCRCACVFSRCEYANRKA